MAIQSMLMIFIVFIASMIAVLGAPDVTFARVLILGANHENDTLNILLLSDIKQCVDRCQNLSDCKFINYMTRQKTCTMTVYVGKKPWDRCRGDYTRTCMLVKKDCNPPPMCSSMNCYGNMFTAGSKKSSGCYDVAMQPIMHTIICNLENQWEGLDTVCGYRSVGLFEGRNILYKFSDHKANMETARSMCRKEGADLIKITSEEKLDHVNQMPVYRNEYFVDATKNTTRIWHTSDGENIPQGDNLWNELALDNISNGWLTDYRCASLTSGELEPKACNSMSLYICELYVE